MDELRVSDALGEIFTLFRRANKYIDETLPWVLGKDPAQKERLDTVLYNLLETIRFGATLLAPFLPRTADRIFAQLGIERLDFDSLQSFGGLNAGHTVGTAEILFARLDQKVKLEEVEAYYAAKSTASAPASALPERSEERRVGTEC